MALPTNIFIGKAKASTPQTKKQFSTHKPWDQPVSSEAPASNKTDIIIATPPLAQELRPNSDQSQSTTKIKVSSNSDQSGIKPSLELDETQIKVRAQPRPQLRPKSVQKLVFLPLLVFSAEPSFLFSMPVKHHEKK